jgi:O-antigen/teichoic acid export membrane protein
LFSTYEVGAAGALVAAATLFSGLGQLNLSGMLMRFLPRAGKESRRLVLATYGFAATTSALLAGVALVAVKLFASPNSPLYLDSFQSIVFVLAVTATAIFTIQDSVLVGLRRAIWVPVENGAFGLTKILTLFILAPIGTAFALFSSWIIPLTLMIPVISGMILCRLLPLAPKPRQAVRLGRRARSAIVRFTVGDATAGLFTQTWTYLLPVIITASLGPSVNALFYTSFLFSSTVDQVAANYASPLTVEGAHAPDQIAALIRLTLRHIFLIIFPVIITLTIASPWILRIFGPKYVGAVPLLCLLLIACIPKAVSTVYYSYCRVRRATRRLAIIQAYVCVATLSAVLLLARPFGLISVGFTILTVQSSTGAFSLWALRKDIHRFGATRGQSGRHRRPLAGHEASGG